MKIKKVLSLIIPMTFMISLFAGCSGMLDVPGSGAAIGDAPTAGTEINFTGTDSTGTTVSFGAATDTESEDTELLYRVVTADSLAELDTVAEALALDGDSIVRDWSTDTGSETISGLTSDTTHWYAVLVKDSDGNVTLYDPRSVELGSSITAADDVITDPVATGKAATITTASLLANDSNNIGDDSELKIVSITETTSSGAIGSISPEFSDGDTEMIYTGTSAGTAEFTYAVQIGDDVSTLTTATVTLTVVNDSPPTAGSEVSFSETTSTSTTVSFGAATDSETDNSELLYRVVTADTLAELDTVEEALALEGASIARDWSTDTDSLEIADLTPDATCWYAVLVKDELGNVTLYDPRSVELGSSITAVPVTISETAYVDVPVTITTASLLANDSNNIGDDSELKIVSIDGETNGSITPVFAEGDSEIIFTGDAEGAASFTYTVQIGDDVSTQTTATVTLNVVDNNPPVAGTEVSFTGTTDSETVVSWGPGTDTETDSADLEYKIVTASTLEDLNTVAEADALTGASIARDWSADSSSETISGLNSGTTYWVAVLMRDEVGEIVLYDPRAVTIGQSVTAVDVTWTDNVYVGIGADIPVVNLVLNDSNNVGDDIDLKIVEIKNVVNGSISPAFSDGDTSVSFVGASPGAASFDYVVQIGDDASTQSEATVTMTVTIPPIVLTAVDDSGSVQQKGETYFDTADLLANDVNDASRPTATLSITSVSNEVGGTAVLSGDGSTITFTSTDIAGNPASFDYTLSDGTDADTGTVNITATPLTTIEALIFIKEDHVFQDIQDDNPPPTVRNIFDKWGRFEGQDQFWADGVDAEADADADAAKTWTLIADEDSNGYIDEDVNISTDNTTVSFNAPMGNSPNNPVTVMGDIDGDGTIDGRVMQRQNAHGDNALNGFVSPKKYENYTHEVTLWSADSSDDDMIGVVAAYINSGGKNYVLYFGRTYGGVAPNNGWGLVVAEDTVGQGDVLVNLQIDGKGGSNTYTWGDPDGDGDKNDDPDTDATNDIASRIKIVREGDNITAWCSDWMQGTSTFFTAPTYNTDSKIEIDLSATVDNITYKSGGTTTTVSRDLTRYQGEQYYGYTNYSQAMATFVDINFSGGLDPYTIVLISQTNLTGDYYDESEVWKYESGVWVYKPALSVQDELDYVRDVVNVQTGKTFTIRETSIEDVTE